MSPTPEQRRAARHQLGPGAGAPAGRRGPSRGSKQPITVEAIISTAFGIVESEGYEALTMRRVATALVTTAEQLIAVRALTGVAAAMTTPGSAALAFRLFSDDDPVSSAVARRRIVSASYPSVATMPNAVLMMASTVIGCLLPRDGPRRPAGAPEPAPSWCRAARRCWGVGDMTAV